MTRPRIGVIGGGIFGASAALELAGTGDVLLFEGAGDLLSGATYANHNRHHYGYHYPRSAATARQCLEARASFEELYADALVTDFDDYYCVARDGSKTDAASYLRFCDEMGLGYEETWPPPELIDRSLVALCVKVREPVYDVGTLRRLVAERLAARRAIEVLGGHRVRRGSIAPSGAKTLEVDTPDGSRRYELDVLVNATYSRHNEVCDWFGFPRRRFQFNLQELDIIRIPGVRRFGMTIQDGAFPSVLPFARGDEHVLAHVVLSQLVREESDASRGLLSRATSVTSAWEDVLRAAAEYIPVLRRAVYRRSIFTDRVVDAGASADDARLSEITAHGSGCWSIFGAKVITAVDTARTLRALVEAAS